MNGKLDDQESISNENFKSESRVLFERTMKQDNMLNVWSKWRKNTVIGKKF